MDEGRCIMTNSSPMTRSAVLDMERFAEFLARMVEKYGREVLAEIEEEEIEKKENRK